MIGRPQASEAAEYYLPYIEEVHSEDPLSVMIAQLDEAQSLLPAISEKDSLYRYAPDKWSIRQVVNHCTDTERVFVFRTMWFARGLEIPLPSYEQDVAVRGAQAESVPWSSHIEEFRDVRAATISFFRNLPPEAWMRTGIASEKRFTVRALAFIIPGHVAYHWKRLRELYL